jgi:DNA-nicking Smr family endonuclease
MSGSRRHASEEERALFHETLRDAKPLRRVGVTARQGKRPVEIVHRVETLPPMPIFAHGDAPAIGGHREAHLRRGRLEPEARIDLHGLTQEEGFRALMRFFARAQGLDQRVVLVITGKGGVLRTMVPRWLADADLAPVVSGISPAHVKHGGPGAFYVALRRKRGSGT